MLTNMTPISDLFSVLGDISEKAETIYNVNPLIFIFLYMVSFIPYYIGVYMLGIGLIKRNDTQIMRGIVLNRIGWGLPYLYVLVFGRNLPTFIYVVLILTLVIGVVVSVSKKRQKALVNHANDLMGWVAKVLLKIVPPTIKHADAADIPAALKLEYQVFRTLGYTEKSENHQIDEYAKYLDQSTFYVALWAGQTIGVLRLIAPGKYTPPVISEFEITDPQDWQTNPALFEEVGVVAVAPLFINAEVGKLLYRAAWQDAKRRGIRYWGAVIEKWLLKIFNDRYHFPFEQFGQEKYYMGAVVYPVVMDLQAAEDNYQKNYPAEYQWFLHGQGK